MQHVGRIGVLLACPDQMHQGIEPPGHEVDVADEAGERSSELVSDRAQECLHALVRQPHRPFLGAGGVSIAAQLLLLEDT